MSLWFFEPDFDPSVSHIHSSDETPATQENMPLNVIIFNATKTLPLEEVKWTTHTLRKCGVVTVVAPISTTM